MNKWLWLLLTISCWMAAGFALCGPRQGQESKNAALLAPPERIVSMAPNLTEILFALGLDKEIAGVSQYSDYPPAAREKPRVGSFWQPNIESVVAAKPDLVITLTTTGFEQQKRLAMRLARIGYNSLTLKIETIADGSQLAASGLLFSPFPRPLVANERRGRVVWRSRRLSLLQKKLSCGVLFLMDRDKQFKVSGSPWYYHSPRRLFLFSTLPLMQLTDNCWLLILFPSRNRFYWL